MKFILTHKSWSTKEILAMLRTTYCFTMCNLPHYRYSAVKKICRELERKGYIKVVARKDFNVHWKVTDKWNKHHDGSDLV